MPSFLDQWAEPTVLRVLERFEQGSLVVQTPTWTRRFGAGEPAAILRIHDAGFFRRVLTDGEIGLGEAYMRGDWSTPDLVALARVMLANRAVIPEAPSWLASLSLGWHALAHWRRDNSRKGSKDNIRRHYDLGNDFFRLFLDRSLLYSCAFYAQDDDSLEQAQVNKLRMICDKLALTPDDHVLEIGTGWGGFALFAAANYGCRVTTTTISGEQHAYASALVARAGGAGGRVEVRSEDYRDLRGTFDKIVSIEMFEAVGWRHYDDFFGACDRLLAPGGSMLLQTITVDDWRFSDYRKSPSWIAKYIFPGSELASVSEVLASLSRVTRMGLGHVEHIGVHYARTLHEWRERFHARLDEVRAQGFDESFIRMWDLYLGYREAAFLDGHIGDVQLVLTRSAVGQPLSSGRSVRMPAPAAVGLGVAARRL